jgi:para-aminobenzoate synthetase component I
MTIEQLFAKFRFVFWGRTFLEDNRHNNTSYYEFDEIIALSNQSISKEANEKSFGYLQKCFNEKQWLFGHLNYDLKNETEELESSHQAFNQFPEIGFFRPEVLMLKKGVWTVLINETPWNDEELLRLFQKKTDSKNQTLVRSAKLLRQPIKEDYLKSVNRIKKHIQRGDIYEVNYCIDFSGEYEQMNSVALFHELGQQSKAPFSVYYKNNEQLLICASPERFLKISGTSILSQPIKGTIKRGADSFEDERLIESLRKSEKDIRENVMIVDLVRNDLSRSAKPSSVKVNEFCEVYSFGQVHQLISTVSAEIEPDSQRAEIIRKAFPMGSMTGAPKIRAMQIIEEQEVFKRGLFSGSVCFMQPNGDFDSNVVIRSLFINEKEKTFQFAAGSAITHYCSAEEEYHECLLKAGVFLRLLNIPFESE